ncbi:DUF1064 domain-containing protein [Candidatus Pacearchaeota archaeon]|nr:DUF1064 domain-containing protein [Candidatus Pacearchaeota archaeon]
MKATKKQLEKLGVSPKIIAEVIEKKASKHRNQPCIVNGKKFPSQVEGKRYLELLMLQRMGKISGLKLQPRFELQPAYEYKGEKIQALYYRADFTYYEILTALTIVEDSKGWDVKENKFRTTDVYKLKKKLLLYKYPDINFREV